MIGQTLNVFIASVNTWTLQTGRPLVCSDVQT